MHTHWFTQRCDSPSNIFHFIAFVPNLLDGTLPCPIFIGIKCIRRSLVVVAFDPHRQNVLLYHTPLFSYDEDRPGGSSTGSIRVMTLETLDQERCLAPVDGCFEGIDVILPSLSLPPPSNRRSQEKNPIHCHRRFAQRNERDRHNDPLQHMDGTHRLRWSVMVSPFVSSCLSLVTWKDAFETTRVIRGVGEEQTVDKVDGLDFLLLRNHSKVDRRTHVTTSKRMRPDDLVRLLAGTLIIVTAILGWVVSNYVLIGTLFIGANLAQSAVTGFCPPTIILNKLGWIGEDGHIVWGGVKHSKNNATESMDTAKV